MNKTASSGVISVYTAQPIIIETAYSEWRWMPDDPEYIPLEYWVMEIGKYYTIVFTAYKKDEAFNLGARVCTLINQPDCINSLAIIGVNDALGNSGYLNLAFMKNRINGINISLFSDFLISKVESLNKSIIKIEYEILKSLCNTALLILRAFNEVV